MRCQVSVFSVQHRRRSIPRFKDQQHLDAIVNEAQRIVKDAIVNEAQRIVKDALESVDSSCPGGRRV